MIEVGMYVRCPMDEFENPRNFICGQVIGINQFTEMASVIFYDPFIFRTYYENIPLTAELELDKVKRCSAYINCFVQYKKKKYLVLSRESVDRWYYYTIQNEMDNTLLKVRENEIVIPFLFGRISPVEQLRTYEFQNPAWYFGRSIVSKTMKILNNSVFGFKELAGCKIYLMPHQLKTIMRCLQEKKCRYMLADEVGMGKTIEAAAVLKIFLLHNTNKKILIAVPRPLLAQWKTELFIKFEIIPGKDQNNNCIELIAEDSIQEYIQENWDFVIVDEVHKLLLNKEMYSHYHSISKKAENILLLSATPVQQKEEEYLLLLQLILPEKYDNISMQKFDDLVQKQQSIRKNTYLVLQDYDDYTDNIDTLIAEEENPVEDEESQELFEDIITGLKKVNKTIADEILATIISEIEIEKNDYGRMKMQEAFLYICDNYQLEKNIIRNRRNYMTSDLAKRTVRKIEYELDPKRNIYEYATYQAIVDWIISQNLTEEEIECQYIPLLMSFFSSAGAFINELKNQQKKGLEIDVDVRQNSESWLEEENEILSNLEEALAEPYNYSSRILNVIDFIDQETQGQKIVLFTSYQETFDKYKDVIKQYFGEESLALFNKKMSEEELELNIYKFQNDKHCFMLLSDETGGEGRNLQSADFIIHIDLPWNANAIEQRIGRLDRIGRDCEKDVCSVIPFIEGTLEEELYKFWDKGLNVFNQSLSGLEIIMDEINTSIIKAITKDFKYGISNAIEEVIEFSQKMEKEVREEQHFDTAAFIYESMNQELTKLLRYYKENENELFANTMLGWASLAGLKGNTSKNGIIIFDEHSFSTRSAENSMLIPPNWKEYINKSSNQFNQRIRNLYEEKFEKKKLVNRREIVGTFKRNIAIEDDYLHFFAPGDEVFNCIIDNAMQSYKGTCTAFAIESDFNWIGVIFNWTLRPNEKLLLEREIPIVSLRQYKHYIMVDQISTPVALPGYEDIDIEQVIKLINKYTLVPIGEIKNEVAHLGRRSKKTDFLHNKEKYSCSNIDWFKNVYRKEQWNQFINRALKKGKEQAKAKFSRENNIKAAIAEINRTFNAEIAQARFFGINPEKIEEKREIYDVVIQALKTSRFELESAAFVMVKRT